MGVFLSKWSGKNSNEWEFWVINKTENILFFNMIFSVLFDEKHSYIIKRNKSTTISIVGSWGQFYVFRGFSC